MTFKPAFDAAHALLKTELPLIAAGEPYTARGLAIQTVSEAVKHLTVVSPEDEAQLRAALTAAHSLNFDDYRDDGVYVNFETALYAALDVLLTLGTVTERVLGIPPAFPHLTNLSKD
jgi:hypothetical protein